MSKSTISDKTNRCPPQIIAHAVWLHFGFPLSLRLVEEMVPERGIAKASAEGRRTLLPEIADR